jgi:hypothetical protein
MFGKKSPKQARGRPIAAKTMNAAAEAIDRLSRFRGNPGTIGSPGGPLLPQAQPVFRLGLTGADGIPARSTTGDGLLGYSKDVRDVSLLIDSPGQVVPAFWESQFDGYNMSAQAIGSQQVTIFWCIGGIWICGWEDCPTAS